VDIDSFSDVVAEVAKEAETSIAAVETADSQPLVTKTRHLPSS
jgi:nucleoside-triphosphatase THEP1